MFSNKYAHFNSLTLLKSMKPRRQVIPEGPDFSNYLSYSPDLNRLANFGLEMMKFLPRFEQLQYADNIYMEEGDEGSVTFSHGSTSTTVSEEWWEAFNEYDLGSSAGFDAFSEHALTDVNGDGRLTNADTIWWAETYPEPGDGGPETDGFVSWRDDQSWVHGQHHRTGNFLTGEGVGGDGWGAMFKNLDFVAEASEWNHIGIKDNASIKNQNAAGDIDRPYFINGILSNLGKSWSDVKNLLETHPALAGKSYYDIIMTKSYTSLTREEATLFAAAMHESRERAWSMMSEVFGPLGLTRNDAAMMPYIREFISSHNPYGNHHALAFFQLFLPIQHSVTNRMHAFYESGSGQGWERSALDEKRFWEFGQWLGADAYKNVYDGDTANADVTGTTDNNLLYAYRNKFDPDSSKYSAVQSLINAWFGAAYLENERPVYSARYGGDEYNTPAADASGWVDLASSIYVGDGHTAVAAYVHDSTDRSLGWDRKWAEKMWIKTSGGDVHGVNKRHAGWADVAYQLWQQGATQSRINPYVSGMPHPQYIVGQFHNLSYNTLQAGDEYSTNWPVYANGMLMKWGFGLDLVRVMEKSAATRVAAARFKSDTADYSQRKEELEDQEKLEEKNAQKSRSENKKWLKKLQNKAKKLQKELNGPSDGSGSGKEEAKFGSADYNKRVNKYAQGALSKSTKKRKAMLNNIKQQNQS